MPEVKIQTITPVHIGAGVKLYKNLDFFEDKSKKSVYIVDHQKIFDIVGHENIENWTKAIENNQDILPIIKAKKPDVTLDDFALRKIPFFQTYVLKQNEILLQLHGGDGRPMLPGSSLKGAIRTAIFTELIWEDPIWKDANELFEKEFDKKTGKKEIKLNDRKISKHAFGDTQNNLMKFLRVGDTFFQHTVLAQVQIANKIHDEWRFSVKGKPNTIQQVECIDANQHATLKIQWPNELLILNNPKLKDKVKKKYTNQLSKTKYLDKQYLDKLYSDKLILFKELNNHTLRLIENEINLIKYFYDKILENYLQKLEQIFQQIKNANENQCYVRLGFATGYLNMTGDWLEEEFIKEDIKTIIRKKVRAAKGEIFPKTRRFLADGTPLGFIKLEL